MFWTKNLLSLFLKLNGHHCFLRKAPFPLWAILVEQSITSPFSPQEHSLSWVHQDPLLTDIVMLCSYEYMKDKPPVPEKTVSPTQSHQHQRVWVWRSGAILSTWRRAYTWNETKHELASRAEMGRDTWCLGYLRPTIGFSNYVSQ